MSARSKSSYLTKSWNGGIPSNIRRSPRCIVTGIAILWVAGTPSNVRVTVLNNDGRDCDHDWAAHHAYARHAVHRETQRHEPPDSFSDCGKEGWNKADKALQTSHHLHACTRSNKYYMLLLLAGSWRYGGLTGWYPRVTIKGSLISCMTHEMIQRCTPTTGSPFWRGAQMSFLGIILKILTRIFDLRDSSLWENICHMNRLGWETGQRPEESTHISSQDSHLVLLYLA